MKHPFLKSALVIASVAAMMSCSDEAIDNLANNINPDAFAPASSDANSQVQGGTQTVITAPEAYFVFNTSDQTYLINGALIVTNAAGQPVGTYNPDTQTISDASGIIIFENVDVNTLEFKNAGETINVTLPATGNENPAAGNDVPNAGNDVPSNGSDVPANGNDLPSNGNGIPATGNDVPSNDQPAVTTSSETVQAPTSSATQQQNQNPASSATQQQPQQGNDATCFDKRSGKNVKPYTEQVGANGEKYAYKNDCSIDCWWDGSNANCANIFGNGNGGQQQPQSSAQQQWQQSSASQPKSSASQQPQSSAQQQWQQSSASQPRSSASQQSGSTPNFTPVSGGKSGSAWGSRYWDGCKPSCGWKANSPGNTAHSCDRDGTTRLTDLDAKNISDGGNAGVCLDQAPRVSNNVAYAYAASHTNGDCGKCFLLEFDGTSHDGTETSGLKGKKMVIMISNIGGDVGGNQFDIMIPGGGVGIFDCISGNNPLSTVKNVEKYGGILTTCGGAKKGANLTQVKSCVKGYCEKISNADAKAGCMFMAEWYEAANNPNFSFKEVQCPSELTSRF